MNQGWFEMPEVRRRTLATAVWIPLRATEYIDRQGAVGRVGYREEFNGVGTVAVPLKRRDDAEALNWKSLGAAITHGGHVDGDDYVPCDIRADVSGTYLALQQRGNSIEHPQWHLHQDFTITLGLKREGDVWVSLAEDYLEVAKLVRDERDAPVRLEVRASHLRDYLCARDMALRVGSYRSRREVVRTAEHIAWPEGSASDDAGQDRWEGRVAAIHEGGGAYGAERAVFHVARTDVDREDDVPVLGPWETAETVSRTWTVKNPGGKLYQIEGQLWRTQWIEPAERSVRVRGDEVAATVFFTVDAEGRKEGRDTLCEAGRWLWFRPEVIRALIERRGGGLRWYTRDTGEVACSPDHGVHFGINPLGLVNAYAEEIAFLPDWQQAIWAGFNVGADGGLSEELYGPQVEAMPAATKAPEAFLGAGLDRLASIAEVTLGLTLIRPNPRTSEILLRTHRFRATDRDGLCVLAKDLVRLTADRIDAGAIQILVPPPKGEKWRSFKSLEKLLATRMETAEAERLMSPLFGIYELRLVDAHLRAVDEVDQALRKIGVNQHEPFVVQGYQVLQACVSAIYEIGDVLDGEVGAQARTTGSGPPNAGQGSE